MRWLMFSDLHLDAKDSNGKDIDGVNFRFTDKIEILKKIVDTAIEEKVDFAVNLGDTFSKSRVPARYKRMFFETLKPLWDHGIKSCTLVGNHEKNTFENLFESEQIVSNEFNIIVSKQTAVGEFAFIPYVQDFENIVKDLPSNIKYAFCHNEVEGAITFDYQARVGQEAKLSDLRQSVQWYFGHYHSSAQLSSNVHLIGACSISHFSEETFDHYYYLCNSEQGIEKFFTVPDRRFVTIEHDFTQSDFEFDDQVLDLSKNSVVRTRFKTKRSDTLKTHETLSELRQVAALVKPEIEYIYEDDFESVNLDTASYKKLIEEEAGGDEELAEYALDILSQVEEE